MTRLVLHSLCKQPNDVSVCGRGLKVAAWNCPHVSNDIIELLKLWPEVSLGASVCTHILSEPWEDFLFQAAVFALSWDLQAGFPPTQHILTHKQTKTGQFPPNYPNNKFQKMQPHEDFLVWVVYKQEEINFTDIADWRGLSAAGSTRIESRNDLWVKG